MWGFASLKNWRIICWLGVIIGIITIALDSVFEIMPDALIILLEAVSIFLIFYGLVHRRKEKAHAKDYFENIQFNGKRLTDKKALNLQLGTFVTESDITLW